MSNLRQAAQQALQALNTMRDDAGDCACPACAHADAAVYAIEQALAEPEPEPWHKKISGMEVSMDVSTGEDDIDHRIYGWVYEVIEADEHGTPDVILAIKEDQNYTAPTPRKPLRTVTYVCPVCAASLERQE